MATRTYRNDEIEILWDSSRCIHSGLCLQGYPEVFDVDRRPWVELAGSTTDQVVATVESCPSGALRYHRLDGGADEAVHTPTTVIPWPNGPYFVRGNIEIMDRRGEVFTVATRATLCRCGASKNQPFCDLSHRDAGFRSYPRAESEPREDASSPSDLGDQLG